MKKYFEILRKCPLFKDIDDSDLLRILGCLGAKVEAFDKNFSIMLEGSQAKYIGIVLSGSVHVIHSDYYGNRSILSDIGPSDMFGEAFACAGVEALPVSVVANQPSEVMFIDSNHILHTCSNNCSFHRQLIFNLMKDLATKTIMFHQRIQITSKRTTRDKLMEYLMLQSKKHGSSSFDIPFDRQELADYLEVDRSGLSSEISKLKKEGIIDSYKNHFRLL